MNETKSITQTNDISFWKTFSWSSFAIFIKMLSSFVVAKIIAIYAGAATFGLFGQFISFVSLVQLASGAVLVSGVSKYTSQYIEDKYSRGIISSTSLTFSLISSIVFGTLICIFSAQLSLLIFHQSDFFWVFIFFGLFLFSSSLNSIIQAIFTGLNQIKSYVVVIIAGAILSVIMIGAITYFYHTIGALIGYVATQLLVFFIAICVFAKNPVASINVSCKIDKKYLIKLIKFSSMSVVSIVTLPLAQMYLRSYVVSHSTWADAGYWQGMLKISDAYLLMFTTAISTYVLPKFSRAKNKSELVQDIFFVLKRFIPMVSLIALIIYFLRGPVILILFTKQFLVMKKLFAYQLMGDLVKVISWVIVNALIARAKIKFFTCLEVFIVLTYVILSIIFYNIHGLVGLTQAFFIVYLFYLMLAVIAFKKMDF